MFALIFIFFFFVRAKSVPCDGLYFIKTHPTINHDDMYLQSCRALTHKICIYSHIIFSIFLFTHSKLSENYVKCDERMSTEIKKSVQWILNYLMPILCGRILGRTKQFLTYHNFGCLKRNFQQIHIEWQWSIIIFIHLSSFHYPSCLPIFLSMMRKEISERIRRNFLNDMRCLSHYAILLLWLTKQNILCI